MPPPAGVSSRRLQLALRANSGAPRSARAACQPATAAQRAAAPFGHTTLPVFVCLLTSRGHRDAFAVQVLTDGCFVAERTTPGQAVYGCGAGAVS
jgi:hypothetical protein